MVTLRIRQAQCALDDGRLDEAFKLAQDDGLLRHRSGQDLVGRLAKAFAGRGGEHLAAGRLAEALADCNRAAQLGGNTAAIAQLRADVARAMADRRRARHNDDLLLATAGRQMDNGHLSAAMRLLDDVDKETDKADGLRHAAQAHRQAAEATAEAVEGDLERGDWTAAIDRMRAIEQAVMADQRLAPLARQLTEQTADRTEAAVNAGRIDQAKALLDRLGPLGGRSGRVQELAAIVRQCRQAATLLERGELRQAGQTLRRLASILPGAAWLPEALESCEAAAEQLESLHAGPLGLLRAAGDVAESVASAETVFPAGPAEPAAAAQRIAGGPAMDEPVSDDEPPAGDLPARFLIRADGVGGFLVLRDAAVTIGPISSSQRPDVGLMADPALPVVTIERSDEDYFLRSDRPVTVNDQPATERLLADGDRIVLAPRCRLRFCRPNAASTSAVLELTGTRLAQADVRRVLLLDRELLIGRGPTAHIRADRWDQTAVLRARGGCLLCRSDAAVLADGRPLGSETPLPLDAPVQIGPIRLVVETT